MTIEMTYGELMCMYCSLFRTISGLKEAKIRDHQRYGERYDERHEITIQAYTALAEKLYDMMEEADKDEDRTESV